MDTNTLMMLMLMGGNNRNMMMPLLLMMMMGGGGTSSLGLNSQSIALGLLPGIGTLGKYMLGGVGAVVAGKMLGSTRRRRRYTRPRTIVVNRRYGGYRRRY